MPVALIVSITISEKGHTSSVVKHIPRMQTVIGPVKVLRWQTMLLSVWDDNMNLYGQMG